MPKNSTHATNIFMLNTIRIASFAVLASLCVTASASAQKHTGFRASMADAPSGNASDNTGVNTGSSSGTTGGTFAPGNSNTSTPNATTGAPAGGSNAAPNAAGVTVSSTGNVSGTITTPPAQVVASLATGNVTVTTSTGGTISVSIPPAAGAAVANAITNPSAANGQAAGAAVAGVLSASGLPGGVVTAVSNAITSLGTTGSMSGNSVSQAVQTVRAALASGSMTPDQAKGLVAVLVALRAGAGR